MFTFKSKHFCYSILYIQIFRKLVKRSKILENSYIYKKISRLFDINLKVFKH